MTLTDKTLGAGIIKIANLTVEGDSFELVCYETVTAIKSLKENWQFLENSCLEDFTYFQSYNWCIEYYRQFADDLSNKHCPIPQVFVLTKDQKPIMIWPLMRIQSRTTLKILTTATEPLGQYCNLIFDSSLFTIQIGQSVLGLILEHSKSDSVSFNNYPANCMIDKILANKGIKENSELESSILDMEQYNSWENYTQSLSKGQRKERRRNKNKLEAKGKLSYQIHNSGTDEYKKLISLALEMKTQWLLETGRKPGILADECTKAMFVNLQSCEKEKSRAIVQALYLDENPIAIEFGMIKDQTYYSYLGAIDWAFKDFGPGKVQMAMAQEWCMENGIKNFDLMHDPSEYKSSWSNHTHKVISRNIPITKKGYIYSKLWKTHIRPRLKKIYHFAGSQNRERLNKAADVLRKLRPKKY